MGGFINNIIFMEEIIINWQTIQYKIRNSNKAKNIKISINSDWELVLVLPKKWLFQSQKSLIKKWEEFMKQKWNWILKHIWKTSNFKLWDDYQDCLKNKEKALKLVSSKVMYWSEKMWVSYNKIFIKNQKTKWGSCSSKRNLNFNYKIIYLEAMEQDYLVVHELGHLKYMNHQKEFWDLVCSTLWSEKYRKYKIKI